MEGSEVTVKGRHRVWCGGARAHNRTHNLFIDSSWQRTAATKHNPVATGTYHATQSEPCDVIIDHFSDVINSLCDVIMLSSWHRFLELCTKHDREFSGHHSKYLTPSLQFSFKLKRKYCKVDKMHLISK